MKKVAIIGAGISGLFIANLFKKKPNYEISIYEKNDSINLDEGYGIQLSVNSIKLLNKIGFDKMKDSQKFYPKKLDFYLNNKLQKFCELEISKFNSNDCKYTTLKRSTLINFLKSNLEEHIKVKKKISKIEQENQQIMLHFENKEINVCDYLIISDGVFSKSKNLIFNSRIKPKYNGTLAIRGTIDKSKLNIDNKNISLFLNSDFHHVIYPVNSNDDLNFTAIMKYKLSESEKNNFELFNDNSFIKRVLDKFPKAVKFLPDNLNNLKIFPVFVSDDFYNAKNEKIHLIGDAFFAFPPSFAQGATQSIEGAYELFESIENNTQKNFFKKRVSTAKMINNRSKFNQFAFHLSSPLTTFLRNIFLKKLVKNRKFLEFYLGKIYNN
tara:strand:- start:913 stop:2058 length:1146 start_codon:yes stop_codon:yes gene_type:complete